MTKTKDRAGGAVSLVYQCRLPLSTRTLMAGGNDISATTVRRWRTS
ncbi:hypothetical protein [Streptomyces sp. 130]|nr:hypothetical protein [Streptomyces sp. 130]